MQRTGWTINAFFGLSLMGYVNTTDLGRTMIDKFLAVSLLKRILCEVDYIGFDDNGDSSIVIDGWVDGLSEQEQELIRLLKADRFL